MALILSLESSSNVCGVCLSGDEGIIGLYSIFERNMHDKYMAELVRRVLRDYGITSDDLNAVAVSAGPGSFTGLRIAGSIAKGLCFGGAPKFISVPTLDALAFSSKHLLKLAQKDKILATAGSHKDLYYCRLYDGNAEPIEEILTLPLQGLREKLKNNMLLAGHAMSLVKDYEHPFIEPRAEYIAELAHKLYKEEKFSNASEYAPLYVQEFVPRGFNTENE